MGWVKVLLLLPLIIRLIHAVEGIVSGAKQGQVKKELVMEVIGALLSALVSGGVIAEAERKQAADIFSGLVDQAISILNDLGIFKHSGSSAYGFESDVGKVAGGTILGKGVAK